MRSVLILMGLGAFLAAAHAKAETGSPRSLFSVASEPPAGFASESELGLALQSGNTRANRVALKQQTSYRWPEETIFAQARYLNANAAGVLSASSWSAALRYERRLVPQLGGFVGQSVESDLFAGYLQRYASDLGVRRTLWSSEETKGAAELGYRYQFENRVSGETAFGHIVRVYVEGLYQFDPKIRAVASVEALPSLRDSSDWRLNADLSVVADLTGRLALKTTYQMSYNHQPAAAGLLTVDTAITGSALLRI
jgi:putative salt-induced outer membrane protein YdiY